MIIEIMQYCNNYFFKFKRTGKFKIEDDCIIIDRIIEESKKCEYVTIESNYEHGIYKVVSVRIDVDGKRTFIQLEDFVSLKSEDDGIIFFSLLPKKFKDIVTEIENQILNNDLLKPEKNVIVSESLGNYSYTKVTNNSGMPLTWKDIYSDKLKSYKKIFPGYGIVPEY